MSPICMYFKYSTIKVYVKASDKLIELKMHERDKNNEIIEKYFINGLNDERIEKLLSFFFSFAKCHPNELYLRVCTVTL